MKFKLVSLLIIGVMLMSFVACGGNNKSTKDSAKGSKSNSQNSNLHKDDGTGYFDTDGNYWLNDNTGHFNTDDSFIPSDSQLNESNEFDIPEKIIGKYTGKFDYITEYLNIQKDTISVCADDKKYEFTPKDSIVLVKEKEDEIHIIRDDEVNIKIQKIFRGNEVIFEFYSSRSNRVGQFTVYSKKQISEMN